jgi:hypothetical protein
MKALALLACALFVSTPVFAQTASKESINRLLKAANAEQMLTNIHAQLDNTMKAAMTQALKSQNAGSDAQQYADAFSKKMSDEVKAELSWEKMRDLYQQVYAESFTQEEVDGLIAFYESPAGKAFVAKMPTVMQKSMALMQQRMAPMVQRLQQSLQETVLEVQKKNAN